MREYPEAAVARARYGALDFLLSESADWLDGVRGVGQPRSWAQEEAHTKRRGYDTYDDDFEAPPIAGYEALEREGLVERLYSVIASGEERIRFRLVDREKALATLDAA